jgi:GR25 family glycosyltransferase involved in LPS biosynthesis
MRGYARVNGQTTKNTTFLQENMAIRWSGWKSLAKPQETEIGRPFALRNHDGSLEVFANGLGEIFNTSQTAPNGPWKDGWLSKGRPSANVGVKSHVVGSNADGRQEIFGIGDDNALWQKWQVSPNDDWSEWKTLGRPAGDTSITNKFALGKNQDGRQEVFAVGSDGNIWQIWQTAPNGAWSDWTKLGKPPAGVLRSDRITVGSNLDRRLELFVIGVDGALWHIWQVVPNAGWSGWESLSKPEDRDFSEPLVRKNGNGRLEVFASANGAFYNRCQEVPNSRIWQPDGWNEKPKVQLAVGLTRFEVALNFQSRLEAFAFGDDGALWHAWQIDKSPNWSAWQSLGSPPAKIRAADHLTIGTNQDGRLEVFLIGQDGAVWHIWQTRSLALRVSRRRRPVPRVLILTIDRAAGRRALSIDQIRAEGLEFEIVDGIDGRLSVPLPCTGTWGMSNTEIACYYTHCRAYRRILDYGWSHGLILEDDFRLLEFGRFATILDDLPPDCDFLALHRFQITNDPVRVHTAGEKFNRLSPCALCLPAYVISSRLAAHILSVHRLPHKPIDHLFCEISMNLAFGFYELSRPIVNVTGLDSTIHR